MARSYGKDIYDDLITLLDTELNTMLETIRVERSVTGLLDVRRISNATLSNDTPECNIMLGDSLTDIEEMIGGQLVDNLTERYPAEINIYFEDSSNDAMDYMEYYIEALTRVLHGNNNTTWTWIDVKGGIRIGGVTPENYNKYIAGVAIEIRVN